jgi:hypothetical protein
VSEQPTLGAASAPSVGDLPVAEDISGAAVRRGDRVFRGLTVAAGATILVIMAAIAVFLVYRSVPALRDNTANFFTFTQWLPDESPVQFGIAALLFHTLVTGILAMIIAVPCSSRTTRPAGPARPSATSSTCSPRSRRSSTACGASRSSRRT